MPDRGVQRQDLLSLAQAGSHTAQEQLLAQAYAIAQRALVRFDGIDREDAVQEAVLKVWSALGRIGAGRFAAYAHRVAYRVGIDRARQRGSEKIALQQLAGEVLELWTQPEDPEDVRLAQRLLQLLEEFGTLSRHNLEHARLIRLRILDGLPWKSIALKLNPEVGGHALDTLANNCTNRFRRTALPGFRRFLESREFEP